MPPAPDMFGCIEKVRTGVLELERARMDERRRKKAWVKEEDPYLFIKAVNIKRPLTSLKTRLFLRGRAKGTVGLPKPILMRIPQ